MRRIMEPPGKIRRATEITSGGQAAETREQKCRQSRRDNEIELRTPALFAHPTGNTVRSGTPNGECAERPETGDRGIEYIGPRTLPSKGTDIGADRPEQTRSEQTGNPGEPEEGRAAQTSPTGAAGTNGDHEPDEVSHPDKD